LLLQILKAPHFNIGHIGSMGRGKCHAEMSADARFVAAGAADGQVRRPTLTYLLLCKSSSAVAALHWLQHMSVTIVRTCACLRCAEQPSLRAGQLALALLCSGHMHKRAAPTMYG
jgi:hypothetical protein